MQSSDEIIGRLGLVSAALTGKLGAGCRHCENALVLMLMLLLQTTAPSALDSVRYDLRTAEQPHHPVKIETRTGCAKRRQENEIIVCGINPDKYRLPLPNEREQDQADDHVRGEAPSGSAVLAGSGRCGMFQGERRCSKAEAARYGYGQGRDPLSVLIKLETKLVDPDADLGPPPKVP